MRPIAFDTETELIGPGNQAPSLVCLSWLNTFGQEQIVHWSQAHSIAYQLISGATEENPLVGHNVAFDLCVLGKQFPDLMPLIFDAYARNGISDTYVRQRLMDIADGYKRKSYSLQSLADYYLGEQLDKDTWRLRYGELKETPIEQWPQGAIDYAKTDARVTLQVFEAQEKLAGRDICLFDDQAAQCRADFALHLASNRGLRTCPKQVARFLTYVREEFAKVHKVLLEAGWLKTIHKKGAVAYIRNTQLAKDRLEQLLPEVGRTSTGAVQVDEESCANSGDALLIAYSRYSSLQTLLSKESSILERGTKEPIHTHFNVLVNSGRTSSKSPNIQNPPREPGVRECYVPREGFVFASADYEAAELHTLAQACHEFFGYSVLGDFLNQGIDPHLGFAAQLLSISYNEALARKKTGDKEISKTRQMAKAANFGFPGGMGAKSFQAYAKGYGFDLDLQESTELRHRWLHTFPEMQHYFQRISSMVVSGAGNLVHLYSNRRRGLVKYTAACNSFFQGLAADGAKRALFEVQKHCQTKPDSPLFGSHVVNFLHDEIILEVPENHGHEAATQLAEIMVTEFNHFVPDVPVRAGPQLMRCWSKNAKAIYDPQGRLVPWEIAQEKIW